MKGLVTWFMDGLSKNKMKCLPASVEVFAGNRS